MPARSSATLTSVMLLSEWLLLSARYSVWFSTFVIKGMTLSFFREEGGVFGIPNTVQKSSASRPDLYPCRVMGVDSGPCALALPLSLP